MRNNKKKKGQGLIYTSIQPKITRTKKEIVKQNKGKGIQNKNNNNDNNRKQLSKNMIYLPSDIKSLQKQLFYLLAEYQSGNITLRNKIVSILRNLRRRNAINNDEYEIKMNSVYE